MPTTIKEITALISFCFLLLTGYLAYQAITFVVVPDVFEVYQRTALESKQVAGNGWQVVPLYWLTFASGIAAFITMLIGVFNNDPIPRDSSRSW